LVDVAAPRQSNREIVSRVVVARSPSTLGGDRLLVQRRAAEMVWPTPVPVRLKTRVATAGSTAATARSLAERIARPTLPRRGRRYSARVSRTASIDDAHGPWRV